MYLFAFEWERFVCSDYRFLIFLFFCITLLYAALYWFKDYTHCLWPDKIYVFLMT